MISLQHLQLKTSQWVTHAPWLQLLHSFYSCHHFTAPPRLQCNNNSLLAGQYLGEYAVHSCQLLLLGTEWRWDRRQTPKVHVYLPPLWQALINHCYLPPVAHAAFVLHTMRAFLHDGCRHFVSSGAGWGWCTIHMYPYTWYITHNPLITAHIVPLVSANRTHTFEKRLAFEILKPHPTHTLPLHTRIHTEEMLLAALSRTVWLLVDS